MKLWRVKSEGYWEDQFVIADSEEEAARVAYPEIVAKIKTPDKKFPKQESGIEWGVARAGDLTAVLLCDDTTKTWIYGKHDMEWAKDFRPGFKRKPFHIVLNHLSPVTIEQLQQEEKEAQELSRKLKIGPREALTQISEKRRATGSVSLKDRTIESEGG